MKNEVIVIVPMVIIRALQLDDESVCEVYGIKRLSGNQYLFGVSGLTKTMLDAMDVADEEDDSLLSPYESDMWAGMVIDALKTLREHRK